MHSSPVIVNTFTTYRGLMLNVYEWDELADSERPVLFSSSKQQSLHDLPFLFAIVSGPHYGTSVPGVWVPQEIINNSSSLNRFYGSFKA